VCLLNSHLVHNSVNRRINSLESRRRRALPLSIAAAVVRVLRSDSYVRVRQIVLALHLVADVLLDAQVERLVVRVRLDAEREVAGDVADVRAIVPLCWLGRLRGRVPGRSGAVDAVAVLGVGKDVEVDGAFNGGRGVRGVFGAVGAVPDRPVGWSGQGSWWALAREGGRWGSVLLDVVHDCVTLVAL